MLTREKLAEIISEALQKEGLSDIKNKVLDYAGDFGQEGIYDALRILGKGLDEAYDEINELQQRIADLERQ